MRTISVVEMKVAEINSAMWGVPTLILMENAGAAVARAVNEILEGKKANIAIVAGSGGKAGDSFVAARHLVNEGHKVKVYLLSKKLRHPDTQVNFRILKELENVEILEYKPESTFTEEVIIDGILGTGIKGAPRGLAVKAIESINYSKGIKIAIDVPSGVDPETGEVLGVAVRANVTVTMHSIKPGLLLAKDYVGKIIVANIGIPVNALTCVGPGDVKVRVREKPITAKKGDGGKIAVIGGSATYVGAPWLTCMGAWMAGADLVFLLAPDPVVKVRYSPEIIGITLPGNYLMKEHIGKITDILDKVSVVAVGPGMSVNENTKEFMREFLNIAIMKKKKLVLDADALKILAGLKVKLGNNAILTPHLGEASILLNTKLNDTLEERREAAIKIAEQYEASVILKGYVDVIADYTGNYKLRKAVGHQDMSCGGTGDVLTGIAATMVYRTGNVYWGALAASYINAAAGEMAYLNYGKASPTNVLKYIPKVIQDPIRFTDELLRMRTV